LSSRLNGCLNNRRESWLTAVRGAWIATSMLARAVFGLGQTQVTTHSFDNA